MVSDDELERHIESVEGRGLGEVTGEISEEARAVHDELLSRIEATRADAASREEMSDLAERIEAIETRLDAVERRLD